MMGENVMIEALSKITMIQLILEQHGFELCKSTYMQIFFSKYSTINVFSL